MLLYILLSELFMVMRVSKKRRVSITLTDDEFDQLEFVADRFGFSKAAVVTGLLREALPNLFAITEASVPRTKKETPQKTMKRVRGVSAELLGEQIKDMLQ